MQYTQFQNQNRSQSLNEITDTHGPLIYSKEAIWSLTKNKNEETRKKREQKIARRSNCYIGLRNFALKKSLPKPQYKAALNEKPTDSLK